MGLEIATIAGIVGATAAVGSGVAGIVAGNQQRAAARHAADLQQQAQNEQRADNAAKAAAERRQQIRDERIRQPRIAQASANTGAEGSSGELGAIGSVTTQTQANIGYNLGALQRADNISNFNQEAADSIFQGQQAAGVTGIAGSIFGAIGGGANSFNIATRTTKPAGTINTTET